MSFRVFDVKFHLSYPALLLITLSCLTAGSGQLLVLLCVLAAVLHEIGHLVFICVFDGKPSSIRIGIFEVKIIKDLQSLTVRRELLIAFAGVLFNFLFFALAFAVYLTFDRKLLYDFAMCNLVLAGVNLLPVKSFDGGQIAYLCISVFAGDKTADVIVTILTVVCMFPVAICGIYILFTSRHNYSLLFVFLYLLSIFISKELR